MREINSTGSAWRKIGTGGGKKKKKSWIKGGSVMKGQFTSAVASATQDDSEKAVVPNQVVPSELAVPEQDVKSVSEEVPEEQIVSATANEPKVISIAENEDYEVKEMEASNVIKTQTTGRGRYSNTATPAVKVERLGNGAAEKQRSIAAARRTGRDLQSGLELLDVDFLLGIVENTDAVDDMDIAMRKLSLGEMMRSGRVHEIDSNALKFYVMDADGLFGKEVQFECFRELAERSAVNAKS